MAEHAWTVVCRSMVKAQDGPPPFQANISLLDVIQSVGLRSRQPVEEQLEAGEDVYLHIPIQLVSLWMRSDPEKEEQFVVRYRLQDPSGEDIEEVSDQARFELDLSPGTHTTARLNLPGVPFRGFGVYHWITEVKAPALKGKGKRSTWREVSRIPFPVVYETQSETPDEAH